MEAGSISAALPLWPRANQYCVRPGAWPGRFGSLYRIAPGLGRFPAQEVVPMIASLPMDPLHERFLCLLPRLQRHGRISFRDVKCPLKKEEAVAEVVALAWHWFRQLTRRGKDPSAFGSALATYAARAVKCGRRLCGQEKARDALSPVAQRRCGFTVRSLPATSSQEGNGFDEALHDNTQTPVPEQVAFRSDFPAWRRTRTQRDQRLIDDLMA